jgi:hypothetical protein
MAAFGPLLPPAGVQASGVQQVDAGGEKAIGLGATPPWQPLAHYSRQQVCRPAVRSKWSPAAKMPLALEPLRPWRPMAQYSRKQVSRPVVRSKRK